MNPLNETEVRVLGALIEKEFTTPEYYPLTLNGLVNACNQKSNRDPVVQYSDRLVDDTLDFLLVKSFVCRVTGAEMRVPKYKQTFTRVMNFTPQEMAVMTVLMLRGAQTLGEIKGRSGRLYEFADLAEVDAAVVGLINRSEQPLVVKLPRQPGRDARYTHLLCGEPVIAEERPVAAMQPDKDRISSLEYDLDSLKNDIVELRAQFAEFKKQFE